MRNTRLYRKIIVSFLAILFLTFGVQIISLGQSQESPDEIKDGSTRYVVWIVAEGGTGSGVLISKNYRLVVTNAHVPKDDREVQVFFAVRDSSGNIVRARPFYSNMDHQNTLKRLGYFTRGRVIAKYNHLADEPDLAIIELDGFPATAIPLKLPASIDYSKLEGQPLGQPVHILGHPDERPLWQWKAGFFKEKKDGDLLIYADAYFGNSGGPVLNEDGSLIGITKAINQDKGIAFAVPTSSIIDIYKTIEEVKVFSIYNNTELLIKYKIKWNKDEDWKEEEPIQPKGERLHSLLSKDISSGYPIIQYKDTENSDETSESDPLETKSRYFGIGIKDVGDFNEHIEINDALRYQFMSDTETQKISLVKMKLVQTFIIENNTKNPIFFQFRWNEDHDWREEYIKPTEKWRFPQLSELVTSDYPRIRFDELKGDNKYTGTGDSIFTQTGHFDKATKIKDDIRQLGSSPPIYYQFNYNTETKKIFLDELKRTHTFSIQNTSEAHIVFKYRWQENDLWETGVVSPNATKDFSHPFEHVSTDYPRISYIENVTTINNKFRTNIPSINTSTEDIQRIETQTGVLWKNYRFYTRHKAI